MQKVILAVGLLAVSSCATTDAPKRSERISSLIEDVRVGEKTDRICFSSTIDGFRDNTRDSVVLTRGVNDDYLVILQGCPSLDDALSIGLANRTSCLTRADRLIVSDSAFSLSGTTAIGPDQCFVDEIYEWNEDAVEDAEEDVQITE